MNDGVMLISILWFPECGNIRQTNDVVMIVMVIGHLVFMRLGHVQSELDKRSWNKGDVWFLVIVGWFGRVSL